MIEVETIEGKYHIGKVIVDEAPQTPREWDNLGVMACFHGKYSLPNETDLKTEMFSSWDEMEKHIIKELGAIVILPMYMMDHSGLAVSVKQYSCPWDSGQIGFVFVTEEILKNEYGDAGEKSQEKARTVMEAEVETYSQYLNGDVYGYEIYERCPECGHESECVDSCWGYYGFTQAVGEVEAIVKSYDEDKDKEKDKAMEGKEDEPRKEVTG